MRYLSLLKSRRATTPPPPELMKEIMKLGEQAAEAGVLLDTGGLAPSEYGARMAVTEGKLTVTDGPFTETKEMISYAIYEVRSKEEVVEWSSRFMKLHRDLWPEWEGEGEVLQIFTA
ncbi:YciI family protein [Nonomuraea sediminis]|uniref:YciI family protein n=1 Tax=Nonomuraea sediminis TaxID=2835864 RepID=UPI001BDD6F1D|nr:YciI family protein [Nonomuraea sediminis]